MTKEQLTTLRTIADSPEGLTRAELRQKLGIPRSSCGHRVIRLLNAHLIVELDPNDGTNNRLYPSETGKAELAART